MTHEKKNLLDIIEGFDTAMLLTNLSDTPKGRPMAIAAVDDADLWFITTPNGGAADQIREDADALVTLQSRTAYATVHGKAAVVNDPDRLKELWSKAADLYFPDGPEDSKATLLRFSATDGEYWDLRGKKGLNVLADAASALWKGERVEHSEGTHGSASL